NRITRYFSPTTAQQAPSAVRHSLPVSLVHTASSAAQRTTDGVTMAITHRHRSVRIVFCTSLNRLVRSQRTTPRSRNGGGRLGDAVGTATDTRVAVNSTFPDLDGAVVDVHKYGDG